jgi:hypothetical protein
MSWGGFKEIQPRKYICGHCGVVVGAHKGFANEQDAERRLYICPGCDQPTYFDEDGRKIPSAPFDHSVKELPDDIGKLYAEARRATSVSAFSGSVLLRQSLRFLSQASKRSRN